MVTVSGEPGAGTRPRERHSAEGTGRSPEQQLPEYQLRLTWLGQWPTPTPLLARSPAPLGRAARRAAASSAAPGPAGPGGAGGRGLSGRPAWPSRATDLLAISTALNTLASYGYNTSPLAWGSTPRRSLRVLGAVAAGANPSCRRRPLNLPALRR